MTDHALLLHRAQRDAAPRDVFTGDDALDLDAGYAVQQRLVDQRLAEGEHLTGIKLGFTSVAKMRQMGVDTVIGGRLTSGMEIADGGTIPAQTLIHPKVEPEVVFRLARDITPETSLQSLSAAVDGIAAGAEIVDSRYQGFRFGPGDVVADNTSAAAYAVGPWMTPTPELERSLDNLGVVLEIDGHDRDAGSTAAILDNPWRALRAAVLHARRHGIPLTAGQIVFSGAATAAHSIHPGSTVRVSISRLGSVTARMSAGDA